MNKHEMTRAEELIYKIENPTFEEMLRGTTEDYERELLELPEGKEYFDRKRVQQEQEHKARIEKLNRELNAYFDIDR